MYYLPLWFQSIKHASAIHSGVMLLPMILSTVVSMIASGIVLSKMRYFAPFFWLSTILTSIGAGLMTTFTPATGHSKWIGYQVIFGLGIGLGAQQPLTLVQTIIAKADVAQGSSFVMFIRFLGAAIFLPVGQTIFINSLVRKLGNLPFIDPKMVVNTGATELVNLASGSNLEKLILDYNDSLVNVFYLIAATSVASLLGSCLIKWGKVEPREENEKESRAEGVVALDV
jgi:hypothetical protein